MAENGNQIFIVSFGSSEPYLQLSRDLLSRLEHAYPSSRSLLFSKSDLPNHLSSYGVKFPRGFGYWIWKPFVVSETMKTASDGDIILYADGRSGASGNKIPWLEEFIRDTNYDVAADHMTHVEQTWTAGDLLRLFDLVVDGPEGKSGQFAASYFALRVSPITREFVSNWLRTMEDNFSLCRDEPSVSPNSVSFIENRHDQSVFSLLLKVMQKRGLTVLQIPMSVKSGDLYRHHSKHPSLLRRIMSRVSGMVLRS